MLLTERCLIMFLMKLLKLLIKETQNLSINFTAIFFLNFFLKNLNFNFDIVACQSYNVAFFYELTKHNFLMKWLE